MTDPVVLSLPRTYLYVPGNAEDKLAKALTRGADALILDLEDAVPLAEKDTARRIVVDWLRRQATDLDVELWVRVNPAPLRHVDVEAMAGIATLTGLILAKVKDADEVAAVTALLEELGDLDTRLMPLIETSAALLDAREIARGPRVHLLQVGEVDLAGDMGLLPGDDEAELAGLRTLVVLAAKASGLESPVGPVSRITRDLDAFRRSTELVRRQGFMGRACIHPSQVTVVHEVYAPSREEVEEARTVVELVSQAEAAGTGVVLDPSGRLVDPAVLQSAYRVLALAERGMS